MSKIRVPIIFVLIALNCIFCKERIVTIGGCVTEIVYALDKGNSVVAVDQSSTIPKKVKDLPQVGYIRSISSEGILSMFPTKILTTTDIGPVKVIEQINESGVDFKIFDSPKSFEDILTLISDIAIHLDVKENGDSLNTELTILNDKLINLKANNKSKPKIVFFMNPSASSYTAAGAGTKANYLIEYIGGENIFSNDFNKYSKVSKEDVIKYNPDIILVGYFDKSTSKKMNSLFESNEYFESLTAVKNKNIFGIDIGSTLNFGPSFVHSSSDLINKIYFEK